MSKLENFCKALDNGNIREFTTYLDESPVSFREAMAKRGIEVEALVEKNEPSVIQILINNGFAEDHYEDWKNHPDARVREGLAGKGLWPDLFIKDKKPQVRSAVSSANPEYIPYILNRTESEWYTAFHVIKKNLDIEPHILKLFLDTKMSQKGRHRFEIQAIKLRYEALTAEMTQEEAAMTLYERFVAGSPHWAENILGDVSAALLHGYEYAQKYDQVNLFKESFNELYQATDGFEYRDISNRVGLKRY